MYEEQMTWGEALKKAEKDGGHLLTINSLEEQKFIEQFISSTNKEPLPWIWLGFTDEKKEGSWVWITDEKTKFTNWTSGFPRSEGTANDYAILGWGNRMTWANISNQKCFVIVEYDELGKQWEIQTIKEQGVFLDLNIIKQEPNLCVAASMAMILDYYGTKIDQKDAKRILENADLKDKDLKLYSVTYFWKVPRAVETLGFKWDMKLFNINSGNNGIMFIAKEIKAMRPLIASLDTKYGQHAVVVNGVDEKEKKLVIADPNQNDPGVKILTFDEFRKQWNNDGYNRVLIKTAPKP
jgi:hypothetical protein